MEIKCSLGNTIIKFYNGYDLDFIPDVCINIFGDIEDYKKSSKQICIKTDNKELVEFVRSYNWKEVSKGQAIKIINVSLVKSVIIREFK